MECQETVVDMREHSPEELEKGREQAQLLFKFNHTMPGTPEYQELMQKLFDGNVGEGSLVRLPSLQKMFLTMLLLSAIPQKS